MEEQKPVDDHNDPFNVDKEWKETRFRKPPRYMVDKEHLDELEAELNYLKKVVNANGSILNSVRRMAGSNSMDLDDIRQSISQNALAIERCEKKADLLHKQFIEMMKLQVKLLEAFKDRFGVEIENTLTVVK